MKICLSISVLIVLILSGCVTQKQHYYHFQNPQQVTLFKERNEFRLTGSYSSAKDNKGTSFQGAYSITDKFALAFNWTENENSKTTIVNGVETGSWSGQYFDGAFGYFKNFDKYGIFEVYAGWGYGEQLHKYSSIKEEWSYSWFWGSYLTQTVTPIGQANFITNKYYVQPAYGFSWNGIDVAFSTRFSNLNFTHVNTNVASINKEFNEIKDIRDDKSYFLMEPAITFRGGWKYIKSFVLISTAGFLGIDDFPMSQNTMSIGLQLSIAKRFWRKEVKQPDVKLN